MLVAYIMSYLFILELNELMKANFKNPVFPNSLFNCNPKQFEINRRTQSQSPLKRLELRTRREGSFRNESRGESFGLLGTA